MTLPTYGAGGGDVGDPFPGDVLGSLDALRLGEGTTRAGARLRAEGLTGGGKRGFPLAKVVAERRDLLRVGYGVT